MLFVQATIGGAPVTLLVDTGAERTLLTEAAVDRLRLPRDFQHATRTFGIGSPTATWDARLPDGMVLGGTHFPVDSVTVGHFGIDNVAGGSADGLLGADILLAFDLDLDLPAQRITFYRARPECPDAAPPWKEPYVGHCRRHRTARPAAGAVRTRRCGVARRCSIPALRSVRSASGWPSGWGWRTTTWRTTAR